MRGRGIIHSGDGWIANFRFRRKWKRITSILSVFVVIGTVGSLMLPAVTLNRYTCGLEEHTHEEKCYTLSAEKALTCTAETLGIHRHNEDCYDQEGELVCDQVDFVVHVHDDACYREDGSLACQLKEIREHRHDEKCYLVEEVVIDPGHAHDDTCFEMVPSKTPTCGIQEMEGHTHGENCYAVGNEILCGIEESPGHTHDDTCFASEQHQTCTLPETEGHAHTEACYDESGAVICGSEEIEGHTHGENCYQTVTVTLCPLEESPAHTHGPSCCPAPGVLLCKLPESEGHTHSEICYGLVRGTQKCTKEEQEPILGPGESTLICEKPQAVLHIHKGTCYEYDEQGAPIALICGKPEVLAHQHTDACFVETQVQTLTCELPEHTHEDKCREPESLTEEERAQVEGLVAQIAALPTLETINAQFQAFDEAGDADGRETYKSTLAEQVAQALALYDSLSEAQRNFVTNAAGLMALKWLLPEEIPLTQEEQAQVDALLAQLEALPDPASLSQTLTALGETRELTAWNAALLAARESAQAARTQYDALTEAQKAAVTNSQRLTGLEDLLLEAQFPALTEQEQHQVDELILAIESLPTMEELDAQLASFDAQEDIDGQDAYLLTLLEQLAPILAQYDALNEPQQAAVTNAPKLLALKERFPEVSLLLTDEETREFEDVIFMIDILGDLEKAKAEYESILASGSESDKTVFMQKTVGAVEAARDAYLALTPNQRERVTNREKLIAYINWLKSLGFLPPDQIVAENYTDSTYTEKSEEDPNITVTIIGDLPLGAEVRTYPVEFSLGDEGPVLFARDITIVTEDGVKYQPTDPVTVQFSGLTIPEHQELDVFHDLEDEYGGMERVAYSIDGDTVTIQAQSFSTYAIVDAYDLNRIAEPAIDPGTIDSDWINYWSNVQSSEPVTFSAVDASTLAVDGGNGKPSDEQVTERGGKQTDGTVTVSKTIQGTDVENVFDITLKVDTTTNITEVMKDPDMAVVIVMDISNTMNESFSGSTRYKAAMEAAEDFLDKFAAANKGYSRIGYVAFNTDAHQIFGLSECSTTEQARALKNTMRNQTGSIISASNYGSSHSRFTNVEAGLKRGYDLLKDAPNANKYIIFLSDGFPTTYIKSGYNGWDPYCSSGTKGADGVFYDYVTGYYCSSGTSYSDKASIRAREMATKIKNAGTKIFSIGVNVGGQTIDGYDHRSGLSVIDRTSTTYELGSATDTNAFKNWLGNSIGSGYYYDSTNTDGLKAAYDQIFAEIKSSTEQANKLKWIASDPIPNELEFIGFFDKSNVLQVYPPQTVLTGSGTAGAENTAFFNTENSAISWDIKNSGYTTTGSGSSTTYHYTVTYRVRLKNELSGFVENQSYNTNGKTTLTYQEVTTVDGKETISGDKTIEFPIPAVKGYLGELTFKKVGECNSVKTPLQGAVFELRHDETKCPICRGDGKTYVKAVEEKTFTASSGTDGIVKFERIPSGHVYELVETVVPAGYHRSGNTYSVEVAYDVVTVKEQIVAGGTKLWNVIGEENYELVNETSPVLPNTGGAGTHLYLFSGWAIILIACALMDNSKRKQWKGAR